MINATQPNGSRCCVNSAASRVRTAMSVLVAICLLLGLSNDALSAPPAKAEDILDKFVTVSGGKAAYAKLENRVTKMKLESVGSGLKMNITVYAARPRRNYTLIEADALGQMEKGTDGEIVWENNMMTGPVIKEGQERVLNLRGNTFDGMVNWRKLYKKVECVGVESVEGKPAYKIEMTPYEGPAEVRYYAKDTGLLAKIELTLSLPMGIIPVEVFASDYRQVDGFLFVHKLRRVSMGQEVLIVTESIEHNVDMPKDRFKLPQEIQSLVDKAKAGKTQTQP